MEIIASKPVSISDAKELLDKRKEKGELGYEQTQALEYVDRFATKRSAELVEKLKKDFSISDDIAIKIVEVMPNSASTLKAVLMGSRASLDDAAVNEIVKIIS